jgi:hypothetical protein
MNGTLRLFMLTARLKISAAKLRNTAELMPLPFPQSRVAQIEG